MFVVETDNGEAYDSYNTEVIAVFTSYREASQYLIDDGYEIFKEFDDGDDRDYVEYETKDNWRGFITELDLQGKLGIASI